MGTGNWREWKECGAETSSSISPPPGETTLILHQLQQISGNLGEEHIQVQTFFHTWASQCLVLEGVTLSNLMIFKNMSCHFISPKAAQWTTEEECLFEAFLNNFLNTEGVAVYPHRSLSALKLWFNKKVICWHFVWVSVDSFWSGKIKFWIIVWLV